MVTLVCALVGQKENSFPVTIKENKLVGELKKAIKKEKENDLKAIDADKLQLFLANKDGTWLDSRSKGVEELKNGEMNALITELTHKAKKLQEEFGLDEVLEGMLEPTTKQIHVLVVVPEVDQEQWYDGRRERQRIENEATMPVVDVGWTKKWQNEFRKHQISSAKLPKLGCLTNFINTELPVKIAIHPLMLTAWMSKMEAPFQELMEKLFITSNLEPCVDLLTRIKSRIVDNTVNTGTSEASFVPFWEDKIRHVLDLVLFDVGTSERDSSCSASTGLKRPDFLYIVNSVCIFRGEETALGTDIGIPRHELIEKLNWTYGVEVPYLFGYAAVGFEARIYAITCLQASNGFQLENHELSVFQLGQLDERFRFLLAILNISRLLQGLASLCPQVTPSRSSS
jgi:Crinkler effector protein N-terminal domain